MYKYNLGAASTTAFVTSHAILVADHRTLSNGSADESDDRRDGGGEGLAWPPEFDGLDNELVRLGSVCLAY